MNPIKSLVILGSGGTLVTGAYLTSGYWGSSKQETFKTVSIQDSLSGRKLIFSLSKEDEVKQWEAEFESDQESIKTLLGNQNLNKVQGGIALSNWCKNKLVLDVNKNQDIFRNVEKYCLIRSIASQLERQKKTLLTEGNDGGWSKTYQKRKSTTSLRKDVGLSGDDWSNEQQDLAIQKTWCSTNNKSDFLASDNNVIYTKILRWCTVEGATES